MTSDMESQPTIEPRLPSQSNWIKFEEVKNAENQVCFGGSEYPLYSDVQVYGELASGLGPYHILNANAFDTVKSGGIVLTLRGFIFEDLDFHRPTLKDLKTDTKLYHGGHLAEEITSLVSLGLGIRLKSGDSNRRFDGSDPYGRFNAHRWSPTPSIGLSLGQPIIPMPEYVTIEGIRPRLESIPKLKASLYVELVRAARAYQDALWISESEPHIAWLLFISALEIVANAHLSHKGTPTDNLKELKPNLAELLSNTGGDELLDAVAEDLKALFGATKKFLSMCEIFMPPPPPTRPSLEWMRLEWEWSSMKKILNTVYGLRSKALHAGVPFPAPMCQSPYKWQDNLVPAERAITALAMSTRNGKWVPDDAPIALHTFHHIVRGILLAWWDEIAGVDDNSLAV